MTPDPVDAMAHGGLNRSGPGAGTDAQYGFWVRHLRLGFGVLLGETAAVMLYLSWTPGGAHRTLLWLIAGSWLLSAVAGVVSARWIASRAWRAGYSVVWTLLSSVAVGAVASLDKGLDSPLCSLLLLTVAYAAIAFTPCAAAACGLFTVVVASFVAITDADMVRSSGEALMFFTVLMGVAVVSVAASVNRTRLERHEKRLLDAITEMAEVDETTGCAVGRVFRRRADLEIARSVRNDRPLSLLMIDIDEFKSINDACGHPVGDRVLAALGAVLRANTRSFDLAGRLGGDEFAVLAPDTDPSGASDLAQRIRRELEQAAEVPVTVSIGIGALDPSSPTCERMLSDADMALYQVKRQGGDGAAAYHQPGATAPAP